MNKNRALVAGFLLLTALKALAECPPTVNKKYMVRHQYHGTAGSSSTSEQQFDTVCLNKKAYWIESDSKIDALKVFDMQTHQSNTVLKCADLQFSVQENEDYIGLLCGNELAVYESLQKKFFSTAGQNIPVSPKILAKSVPLRANPNFRSTKEIGTMTTLLGWKKLRLFYKKETGGDPRKEGRFGDFCFLDWPSAESHCARVPFSSLGDYSVSPDGSKVVFDEFVFQKEPEHAGGFRTKRIVLLDLRNQKVAYLVESFSKFQWRADGALEIRDSNPSKLSRTFTAQELDQQLLAGSTNWFH